MQTLQRQRSTLLSGGQNILNSLPRWLLCSRTILKNLMNCSFSLNHPDAIHPNLQIVLVQNSQRGKELNKCCPPHSSDDLCLCFCLYPSSMVAAICQCGRVLVLLVQSMQPRPIPQSQDRENFKFVIGIYVYYTVYTFLALEFHLLNCC